MFKKFRLLILALLILFLISPILTTALSTGEKAPLNSTAYAQKAPVDDDNPGDDDPDDMKDDIGTKKNPLKYLPDDPQVKKLKLQAMELAEKFTKILAERSALQPQLAKLEKNEADLKHLRLKYRLKYLKLRDKIQPEAAKNKKIRELLRMQDLEMIHIEYLIVREEKIDCYHTIFERKHRAMEEYHWNLIDNKHSLIGEYLLDLDIKKHKDQYITLYNETIRDYKRIIKENLEIMKETKEIIEAKKKREVILREIVEELKGLCKDIEGLKVN